MKKAILSITTVMLLFSIFTYAQTPEQMKYQAIARDNTGNVLSNQLVSFRISILQGSSTGTSVYSETHQLTSNDFGLANLDIGSGIIISGNFAAIDWSSGPYFLQVEMDESGGTTFQLMGTSQLLSVPYALHAKTAESVTNIDNFSWSTTGNAGTDPATNFIGTTDDQALIFKVNNLQAGEISTGNNTFYGLGTGVSNTIGVGNTANGFEALRYNSTGSNNTAIGGQALFYNSEGYSNTVIGFGSMTFNTSGHENTTIGLQSLFNNTIGHRNTAIGVFSLLTNISGNSNTAIGHSSLYSNTEGSANTAIGYRSLEDNTSGTENTANGAYSLRSNTTGNSNTATGYYSLGINTIGIENTAFGARSLSSNTIGVANTSTGSQALRYNTTGNHNTAVGKEALKFNTSGQRNTASGSGALSANEIGNDNTAIGMVALHNNADGNENTAIGRGALFTNYNGDFNTANGKSALYNNTGSENTAIGYKALVSNGSGFGNTAVGFEALYSNTGIWNTAIGYSALSEVTSGNSNIGIGYNSQVPIAAGDYQVRIGSTYISYAGIQVGWTITSDKIWKEQIRELPYGIDMLMQLKPVDYYRKNNDVKKREMGFIAQDVEVLIKEMGYDDQGFLTKADNGNLSLRYNDFIALLTKGMQEQQELIEQQNTIIEDLISRIENLENN